MNKAIWIQAWVTWPDGHREVVVATLDEIDRLYLSGCEIEGDVSA